jgi:hypothetical protein
MICQSALQVMFRLLKQIKAVYDQNDFGGLLVQEVRQPEPFENGIPTLKSGVYRQPTPLIEARFKFAGTWTNAGAGHTWLSVSDMETAWADNKILEQLYIRQKYWDASAPAKFEWDRLSLFGVEIDQYEETYLVWAEDESTEPEVYVYSGHQEDRYENLQAYLGYILESGSEESRIMWDDAD